MADEAFALSPISARATLPGEEDYAAISEAFMETSRGRWFLTEYAKRNRNADTKMVLDAVARIEQSLAAQKEDAAGAQLAAQREALAAQQQAADAAAARSTASAAAAVAAAVEAADHRLKAALAAVRTAVETAQASATGAIDGLGLEQRQAAVRKGSRVLREIAWRLREIGNDSRICDLIDAQVAVIERASEEVTTEEAKASLGAAFAAIGGSLAELGDDGRATAPAAETSSLGRTEMPTAAIAETAETMAAPEAAEALAPAFVEPAEPHSVTAEVAPAEAVYAETVSAEAEPAATLAETEAELAPADMFEAADIADPAVIDETADAQDDADDEAILDMIAMEMGAPDPIDDDEIALAATAQAPFVEPPPVEQLVAVEEPEPVVAQAEMSVETPVETQPATVAAPAVEMSLGSSILASGMLGKPAKPANDPLAPIRRMSQVEKIAFFS